MIHARYLHGPPSKNGGPVTESSLRHEIFAAVVASLSAVRKAKRALNENQRRMHHGSDYQGPGAG